MGATNVVSPSIDAEQDDHAYFLGLFATDGHFSETTRNRGRVLFELGARDAQVLARLGRALPYAAHLSHRVRRTNFAASYESVVLTFHALEIRQSLRSYGFSPGRKSHHVTVPIGSYCQNAFWRGVVDGDGSVGMTGKGRPFVSLVTASEPLRNGYVDFVAGVTGVHPNPNRNARDRVYNIVIFDEAAQRLCAVLYPDGVLAIPRKAAAAQDVAAWRRPPWRKRVTFEKRRWSPEEDAVARSTMALTECAALLGRTVRSVNIRRWRLRAKDLDNLG